MKHPRLTIAQFISIQVDVPALGHRQTRQYSLSDSPGHDYYRISIKKENGADAATSSCPAYPGLISNLVHDTKNEGDIIQVSHPFGDFFVDPAKDPETPLVLMSGGVGLTCLTSILNSLVARHSTRPISWVHAARTAAVRAFAPQLKEAEAANSNIHSVLTEGILDLAKLDKEKDLFVSDARTQYYVCGPTAFMLAMEKTLKEYGVDASRIHMELFGTGGVPGVTYG
jgi:nitric oxide dioxygenase